MLLATLWYVEQYDGWGQWAAAPLLLLPVIVSAAMTPLGLLSWWSRRTTHRASAIEAWPVAVAAGPLFWIGWRWMVS